MSEVIDGPFEGHLWGETSIDKLQLLTRNVITNVEEANMRGRRAREEMIRRFSLQIVAEELCKFEMFESFRVLSWVASVVEHDILIHFSSVMNPGDMNTGSFSGFSVSTPNRPISFSFPVSLRRNLCFCSSKM
ncbi:hypothetical protein NC651_025764 [Populus alba x Populus x berolinensis]|nr:hypothetical protein NC651_025764 [Populus alba x Populus x berolinensis]